MKQGFDFYLGLPYSNDMGPAEDGTKSNYGKTPPQRKANAKAPPPADETGVRAPQPPLGALARVEQSDAAGRAIARVGVQRLATLFLLLVEPH